MKYLLLLNTCIAESAPTTKDINYLKTRLFFSRIRLLCNSNCINVKRGNFVYYKICNLDY